MLNVLYLERYLLSKRVTFCVTDRIRCMEFFVVHVFFSCFSMSNFTFSEPPTLSVVLRGIAFRASLLQNCEDERLRKRKDHVQRTSQQNSTHVEIPGKRRRRCFQRRRQILTRLVNTAEDTHPSGRQSQTIREGTPVYCDTKDEVRRFLQLRQRGTVLLEDVTYVLRFAVCAVSSVVPPAAVKNDRPRCCVYREKMKRCSKNTEKR